MSHVLKRLRNRGSAGQESIAAPDEQRARPLPRGKSAVRRRLRRQQRLREALLLDLGAIVFELHRQGRREPELLQAKAAELTPVDEEVRALAEALEEDQGLGDLVAAGIAGTCRSCGALLTTDARFCSRCGTQVGAPPERERPVEAFSAGELGTAENGPPPEGSWRDTREAPELGEEGPPPVAEEEPVFHEGVGPVEPMRAEESPAEEPPAEEPPLEAPPVEGPGVDEPPVEEPPVEEEEDTALFEPPQDEPRRPEPPWGETPAPEPQAAPPPSAATPSPPPASRGERAASDARRALRQGREWLERRRSGGSDR